MFNLDYNLYFFKDSIVETNHMRTNSLPSIAIRRLKLFQPTDTKCKTSKQQQRKTTITESKKNASKNQKKNYLDKLQKEEIRYRKTSVPARAITIVSESDESATESEPALTSSLCIKIR